ncbi:MULTISPECIES: GlxA family transcriptional regulator [Flavobacterium]|uniref:AraC family transcriptional regulator n=1 Tax=Flavobacterium tructae TaxID=1114873 RepID=A0A1S1JDN6_9FLAO|nr:MULTISPECIES: helix-turn-helix domain-containing protein [Flavobacterium]MDL2142461.1 helix-turn-helix domain-containing protein [Flavobacterium tructae]OHT47226.1 AraC family transcriptional regulator [Flavobacterium tructae]OXB19904.1 AraC family transcriptional regulator [Flavobacterium tructae]OXB23460.1 AraC family transcriptional regulator [Flavobacterium tructae]URC14409.1 helix-turn-helix domain-containing protein [Flavobacterium sp. B183]
MTKKVGLIVPHDYKLLSIAAILEVFETANKLAKEDEKPFEIMVFQLTEQIKEANLFGYKVNPVEDSTTILELILIPAFTTDNMSEMIAKNKNFIPWLKKHHQSGAELASFCTGAFLFAASGLLNEKLATTHVDACSAFTKAFPLVKLKPEETLTADGSLYTSGGSTSTFHLLILLVQKYCGNEIAVQIAKIFSIDLNRYKQSYFSTFRPNHLHNDALVAMLQQKIESQYHTIEKLEEITKDIPTSTRNMTRRFKQVTGIPPIEYLQNIRVESSKKYLEQTQLSISEIIEKTGYNDPKAFRKVFYKMVGMKPIEYREKFRVQ